MQCTTAQHIPNWWPAARASNADSSICNAPQDLYRVLVTSLRHSSAQFQSLSIEALTLGLWSLSSAHASLRDDIHGRQLGLQDRCGLQDLAVCETSCFWHVTLGAPLYSSVHGAVFVVQHGQQPLAWYASL